jgi:hypothetical protein
VPALRRLEVYRLITRPKHSFALTSAGKKVARNGWKPLLDPGRADDLDAILRIAEMARANDVEPAEISEYLDRSSQTKLESAKKQDHVLAAELPQVYVTTKSRWNRARLEAEAKFLASLAEEHKKPDKRRR